MDGDRDDPRPSPGALLRRVPLSWWLPLPAVLVHALVLLLSHRVWTTLIETSSRSGRSGTVVDAHRFLAFLAVTLGGYVAVGVAGDGAWTGGRRLQPSTGGEIAVTRLALRGLCLVALYLSAFALARTYAFDGPTAH